LSAIVAIVEPGILPGFADKDFANYWTAARLVLDGKTMDLFGPWEIYFAHLKGAFGDAFPWHNWSYPPHYLLLIWPLGFFGYKAGLLIFMAVTGALFIPAYRAFNRRAKPRCLGGGDTVHRPQFLGGPERLSERGTRSGGPRPSRPPAGHCRKSCSG